MGENADILSLLLLKIQAIYFQMTEEEV